MSNPKENKEYAKIITEVSVQEANKWAKDENIQTKINKWKNDIIFKAAFWQKVYCTAPFTFVKLLRN